MSTKKSATTRPAAKSGQSSSRGRSSPSKASANDATRLLTADHDEVHAMFEEYKDLADQDAEGSERQALAEKICAMLTVHATIEEEIFYPAARDADVDSDLLDEAEVEHASAKDLIAQIQSMGPDDDLYNAKVSVLGEYIDHHVQEEEGELFPKCRKADMDLAALGTQLSERKSELMEEMGMVSSA